MRRIMLVCSGGMSTGLLAAKIKLAARKMGISAEVNAVGQAEVKDGISNIDVLLLGPQVRYLLGAIKSLAEPRGIPVAVINSADYGTMNGEKVLRHALELLEA